MPSSLQQLTPRRVESERNRGKEMVTVNPAANKSDQRSYASQNFAWRLLGKTPEETTPLEAAPSVLLSRLLEHACPGYAALLGKRYGAKQLLIEQEWIADLAFVAGDSTQNLQLTFRVISGWGGKYFADRNAHATLGHALSSPHDPEDGLYTLELIQKALADSCMASALHELKACPLVQSLVLTGQVDQQMDRMPAPKVDLSVWGLNDSQLSAVTFALRNPFALVQGPPGTGKTMTTAVLATCFARQNMASGANRAVLLCTPTNRAADCAAAFVARIYQKQAELRLHERSEVEGNVCAICLCSKPDMITLCSHAFHRQCLLQDGGDKP
eukprot:s715_g4.t1